MWESKLKATKAKLKDWAKANYMEPHREKETLKRELTKIQEEMESTDITVEK